MENQNSLKMDGNIILSIQGNTRHFTKNSFGAIYVFFFFYKCYLFLYQGYDFLLRILDITNRSSSLLYRNFFKCKNRYQFLPRKKMCHSLFYPYFMIFYYDTSNY